MNSQLVDSIIDVIHSLPEAEQQALVAKLNQAMPSSPVGSKNPPILMENTDNEDAWEVFATLGDDAIPGKLDNPSLHHNKSIYR